MQMKKMDASVKMLSSFVIGLIILIVCIGWSNREQGIDALGAKYYKVAVDRNITEDLDVIDKDLEGKEIIFTAEYHGTQANMDLEMKFLKYLKEKIDFKYYLCELSHGQALMLNAFLDSGDTSILDEMYAHYEGTYAYTKDNYNRWLELYEYNQQFDEKDRIQVVGVDVEHQVEYALQVVNKLLPVEAPADTISQNISLLQAGVTDDVVLKEIHKDLIERQDVYKDYLGEAYFDIEMIVRNINNRYDVVEDRALFNAKRDAVMYANFMDVYPTLAPGKFYGQWGHNHTYQAEEGGVKWFAAALAEQEFKDKILTIAYTYNDCETISKNGDKTYGVEKLDTFTGYKLKDSDREMGLLVDLNASSGAFGQNIAYYQYLLIISDSEATEPFKE